MKILGNFLNWLKSLFNRQLSSKPVESQLEQKEEKKISKIHTQNNRRSTKGRRQQWIGNKKIIHN